MSLRCCFPGASAGGAAEHLQLRPAAGWEQSPPETEGVPGKGHTDRPLHFQLFHKTLSSSKASFVFLLSALNSEYDRFLLPVYL